MYDPPCFPGIQHVSTRGLRPGDTPYSPRFVHRKWSYLHCEAVKPLPLSRSIRTNCRLNTKVRPHRQHRDVRDIPPCAALLTTGLRFLRSLPRVCVQNTGRPILISIMPFDHPRARPRVCLSLSLFLQHHVAPGRIAEVFIPTLVS